MRRIIGTGLSILFLLAFTAPATDAQPQTNAQTGLIQPNVEVAQVQDAPSPLLDPMLKLAPCRSAIAGSRKDAYRKSFRFSSRRVAESERP